MELSASMFANQTDYWKARSGLHEGTVAEVALELGCEVNNETILEAISALKSRIEDLTEVAKAMMEWIDAVPKDTQLPAMPGFDRDWADGVIEGVVG